MDRWKSRGQKSQTKRKCQRKEDAGVRKGSSKVTKHCVLTMICGSGGSKSRLAKAAGAIWMRDDKLHAAVARSKFPSQNAQN